MTRIKEEDTAAWYHVYAKVAGKRGDYVLQSPLCQQRLMGLIQHYGRAYFCGFAAFCIMGNHYHLVLRMDQRHEVSDKELERRARLLYSRDVLEDWTRLHWTRFEERLFDLSELMRNIQSTFARWYNDTFDRTGRFWGDRFKSTLLEEGQSVVDCMLYVDLNPVRAGMVTRPEAHEGSSAFARHVERDKWLLNLSMLLGHQGKRKALAEYRAQLYHRGNVPSKAGQASIPDSVVQAEDARGYASSGMYRQRLRYLVHGMAVGSEDFVRKQLIKLQTQGTYPQRKHPISQLGGVHYSLREQRSHAKS